MNANKKLKRLSESDYTQVSINDVVIKYAKEVYCQISQDPSTNTIERGIINDMGFWMDEIQPKVYDISDKYGLSFEQAKNVYEKAWNMAFDKLDKENKMFLNCNKKMNMDKKRVRLSESDLHRYIKESVKTYITRLSKRRYLREDQETAEDGRHYALNVYEWSGDGFGNSTNWDQEWANFTKREAMAEAEYYAQHCNLPEIAVVIDKTTREAIAFFASPTLNFQ